MVQIENQVCPFKLDLKFLSLLIGDSNSVPRGSAFQNRIIDGDRI
jgi:hypothetical protein